MCDNDMVFTDVYCGWPGAADDAHVLWRSLLVHDAEARTDDIFAGQTYIIGDAAYPLKTWLLTGFKTEAILLLSTGVSPIIWAQNRWSLNVGKVLKVDRTGFLPILVTAASIHTTISAFILEPLNDDDDASNFVNIVANDDNAVRKRPGIIEWFARVSHCFFCLYGVKKCFGD